MIEQKKQSIFKSSYILFAFAVSAVSMWLVCIFSMGQFEAESTLVAGDTLEIYIPAIRSLVRDLWSGKGIGYSWNLFFGMNDVGYYAIYAGGSIVNLLYILFPQMHPETFVIVSLVIKAGLAGAFFSLFAVEVLKVKKETAVFFSVCYALCGFQVAINTMNYIWMDAVYLLPLLLFFMVAFVEEKKWLGLTLTYAYLFFSNFYMGYMVGFFSLFFLLLYLLFMGADKKRLLVFPVYVLLAAGLVAFLLVPSAYFILTKNPPDASSQDTLSVSILALLNQFTFGVPFFSAVKLPYLYCGIPVLLCLPGFFLGKEIPRKEKCVYGILTGFLLLSCMIYPLYLFWHGFDVPDGWYHRFAYMISFLCVAMACKGAEVFMQQKQSEKSNVYLYIGSLVWPILLVGNALLQEGTLNKRMMMNGALFCGWIVVGFLLLYIKRKNDDGRRNAIVASGIVVLIMAETIANGVFQHEIFQSKAEMQVWEAETQSAMNILAGDPGLYRVSYVNDLMINSDTYWGFQGNSDFGTYENYEVRRAMENLGAYTSTRVINNYGENPFTRMLLGVKYTINASGSRDVNTMGAAVVPYAKVLNMGYMVEDSVEEFTFAEEDVVYNSNALASCMAGKELEIFKEIPAEQIETLEEGIHLGQVEEYFYLQGEEGNSGSMQILFQTPNKGKSAFAVFYARQKGIELDRPQFYEVYRGRDYGYFGVAYTNPMEVWGNKLVCPIVMQRGVTRDYITYKKAQFFTSEEEELDALYDILSRNQLEVLAYKNGYIKGKVKVESTDQILFTTIPYDSGWKVSSGSGEVEIVPLLDGAFMGVRFQNPGDQELVFSYEVPGGKIGFVVTVISFMVFSTMVFIQRKNKDEIDKD